MSTDMLKDALDFDLIADVFVTEEITASPAELHGQLCGYLASGVTLPLEDWLAMVVEFCDIESWKEEASRAAIVELYTATLTLYQNGEYALVPCMADDDADLADRGVTLSQWAHGFLAGYGLSGQKNDLSEETKQILRDFANISGMQSEMRVLEDSNENEEDLMELVEYVRVSAMMMYTEHHDINPDVDHTKTTPLH
ncbi:YecA family protein [Marinomonas sp. C2222]|uniref:YecA family protein n=1 Tax=Marinomonas sargassi TaxID=2984494 RepID=A0ABT2YUB6_9GAMM|nr:YecA family protein [Marinomonas sargassi]MCV2403451.1 YecA family protein [Marinomonas sargassi]